MDLDRAVPCNDVQSLKPVWDGVVRKFRRRSPVVGDFINELATRFSDATMAYTTAKLIVYSVFKELKIYNGRSCYVDVKRFIEKMGGVVSLQNKKVFVRKEFCARLRRRPRWSLLRIARVKERKEVLFQELLAVLGEGMYCDGVREAKSVLYLLFCFS